MRSHNMNIWHSFGVFSFNNEQNDAPYDFRILRICGIHTGNDFALLVIIQT